MPSFSRVSAIGLSVGGYGGAYCVSLVASLTSASLTYMYVGGGLATERNPVLAAVIQQFGPEVMVLLKVVTVIAAYWAIHWVGESASIESVALGFAWLGATINGVDAAHDVGQVVGVGLQGTKSPTVGFIVLVGGALVGAAAGPVES